jgi:hypothetical protein
MTMGLTPGAAACVAPAKAAGAPSAMTTGHRSDAWAAPARASSGIAKPLEGAAQSASAPVRPLSAFHKSPARS